MLLMIIARLLFAIFMLRLPPHTPRFHDDAAVVSDALPLRRRYAFFAFHAIDADDFR